MKRQFEVTAEENHTSFNCKRRPNLENIVSVQNRASNLCAESSSAFEIDALPNEILIQIFSKLDSISRKRIERVCKLWKTVLRETLSLRKLVKLDLSFLAKNSDYSRLMGTDAEPTIEQNLMYCLRKLSDDPCTTAEYVILTDESFADFPWSRSLNEGSRRAILLSTWENLDKLYDSDYKLLTIILHRVAVDFHGLLDKKFPMNESAQIISFDNVMLERISSLSSRWTKDAFQHSEYFGLNKLIDSGSLDLLHSNQTLEEQCWFLVQNNWPPLDEIQKERLDFLYGLIFEPESYSEDPNVEELTARILKRREPAYEYFRVSDLQSRILSRNIGIGDLSPSTQSEVLVLLEALQEEKRLQDESIHNSPVPDHFSYDDPDLDFDEFEQRSNLDEDVDFDSTCQSFDSDRADVSQYGDEQLDNLPTGYGNDLEMTFGKMVRHEGADSDNENLSADAEGDLDKENGSFGEDVEYYEDDNQMGEFDDPVDNFEDVEDIDGSFSSLEDEEDAEYDDCLPRLDDELSD